MSANITNIIVGPQVSPGSPRVSVVIPAYNVAEFIAETLESVFAQTFTDLETIVVNDGSPDTPEFLEALAPFADRIIYIEQTSSGAGEARNTAIEHARGDLIAFLDGDDIWLPDYLASQVAFIDGGYDMAYTDAYQFGMVPDDVGTFMQTAPSAGKVTAASILDYSCNVITSGTVATKAALERAGLFEPERTRAHDFHLWVRMAKSGAKIGYQRKPLLKYRVHLASLSGDSVSRVEREIAVMNRVLRTIELTPNETAIVERQLAGLGADLQIEKGKAFLLAEDFPNAYRAFADANRRRRSIKMTAIAVLARVAPRTLLSHYEKRRADEIAFVPKPKTEQL